MADQQVTTENQTPGIKRTIPSLIFLRPSMIILLVFLPYSIAFLIGWKYLLPIATTLPAAFVLYGHMKKGRPLEAVVDMLLYVFWLTVTGMIWMYFMYGRAGDVVIHGRDYMAEMKPWLSGEASKEGTPSLFIREHLLHMVVVAVASLISVGFLALLFGTILVNYMNYYVVSLMRMSSRPLLLAVIGWHPWSVLRVIAFIILGCAFAWPLAARIGKGGKFDRRRFITMVIIAILLEIADIMIKTFIGSSWRDLIVANIRLETIQ